MYKVFYLYLLLPKGRKLGGGKESRYVNCQLDQLLDQWLAPKS